MDDTLEDKPQSLLTTSQTMWIFWTMFKKLPVKLKRNHLSLQYIFLILLFEKNRKKLEKSQADIKLRLKKNFCKQKILDQLPMNTWRKTTLVQRNYTWIGRAILYLRRICWILLKAIEILDSKEIFSRKRMVRLMIRI